MVQPHGIVIQVLPEVPPQSIRCGMDAKQIGCDKYSMVPYIYIILYLLVLYIYNMSL